MIVILIANNGQNIQEDYAMQVTHNGKEFNLPEGFTWILFRHGDKTHKTATRGGGLTPLGRKQVWSTSCQLLEHFGQEAMSKSAVIISPAHRVRQSNNIFMSAIDRDPNDARVYATLEWGPDDGHDFDYTIINVLKDHRRDEIVIAVGHNGLFENIANIIHPRSEGWQLPPGHAFIITVEGIEIISPQV